MAICFGNEIRQQKLITVRKEQSVSIMSQLYPTEDVQQNRTRKFESSLCMGIEPVDIVARYV